jgi:hypothetical protein
MFVFPGKQSFFEAESAQSEKRVRDRERERERGRETAWCQGPGSRQLRVASENKNPNRK